MKGMEGMEGMKEIDFPLSLYPRWRAMLLACCPIQRVTA
jgi:hypothetical protein